MGCPSASAPPGTPPFKRSLLHLSHWSGEGNTSIMTFYFLFLVTLYYRVLSSLKILFFLFFSLLHIHTNYNKDQPNYGVSIKHSDDFVNFKIYLITVFFYFENHV